MQKFFQTKGVDISNPKSMFDFINRHYKYFTMNSWNREKSIAHIVKIHDLELTGDPYNALRFLEAEKYETINTLIEDWESKHPGYGVGFNGRSGGYLVLYNNEGHSVIPEKLDGYYRYEDWKADIEDCGYCVKDYMQELRMLVTIIREFDKLCDVLRDYVDKLSQRDFKREKMQEIINEFNETYADDLKELQYNTLIFYNEEGQVDIFQIQKLKCLYEAFLDIANQYREQGYVCYVDENFMASLEED